ncbi:MAG: HD domain-containing phosphohydrolase [Acidobacteriota bacterium]|nr:HD domain-containing phosphohydrolase [Acidobacteriota bacterium]
MSGVHHAAEAFLGALSRAYHSARLYPGRHPATRTQLRALEESARALAAVIDDDVELSLADATLHVGAAGRIKIQHPGAREWIERGIESGNRTALLRREHLGTDARTLVEALIEGRPLSPGRDPQAEAPEPPPRREARTEESPLDPALPGRLLSTWNVLREKRAYPGEEIEAIAMAVVRQRGDGLVEPALLYSARDPLEALACHALNMARLAYLAGRQRGWRGEDLSGMLNAALWCDVGMLEIPFSVWGSERKLSAAEFRLIRKHPIHGARLLLTTPDAPLLAAVVAFDHHRRPGGRGYPQVGSALDPGPAALLIQAADVYAALRTPRTFRPAVEEPEARRLMSRLRDLRLDAEAVDLLLEQTLPQGSRVVGLDAPVTVS